MVLRIIQSDVCEACGHIPLSGRLMRLFLQVIAVLMFAGGLAVSSQSLLAGLCICASACALFFVATRNLRVNVRKLLGVARKVAARTSQWSLGFLFLVLIVVPAWIWWDACFQPAYTWARVDLSIPDEMGEVYLKLNSMGASFFEAVGEPTFYWRMHSFSVLGLRIGVLLCIMCGSAVALLLGGMHILLRGASQKYLVGFALVVSGLVVVTAQQENLLWCAVRQRITNDLPRFERALEPLLQEWPTRTGTLPEIGKFFAHEQRPGKLTPLGKMQYETREGFGADIEKLPDGGVRFGLSPHHLFQLEYHPPGSSGPQAKIPGDDWTSYLTRSDRIKEHWYLTQYETERN